MKKLALIAFLGFSAAALCVNQGNSQPQSTVQFSTASYNMGADTAPMKKTMKKTTMHKKTMKAKKDSTR